jgi:RNA polymerase sigma-70 factor, ECF subfamily
MMRSALAGNDQAYRALLGELADVLRAQTARAMGRYGQGNAEIEDMVQETLLAIHLKRHTWDPAKPLRPWISAVLRHKMIDGMRRRGRRVEVDLDAITDSLAAPEQDPTASGDASALLKHLDDRSRTIVSAITLHGRSAAEVGRELDMSEGAVRVSLHRALKRLAAIYRKTDV